MIHRLLGRQPRNGRKHTEGVGGQEHHIPRVPAHSWDDGILNEADRIGGARILRKPNIGVIGRACDRVENHILQHRAEADGVVDLRFLLLAQVHALRITSTFKIEDPGGAPAVLVVADQPAGRVGGKRRLAGAGKPKK